jgi:hypothetical protein
MRRGQLFHAELAARELGRLTLVDALALALLIADAEPERWPRAAARWHARFVLRGLASLDDVLEQACLERRIPSQAPPE